MKKAQSIKIETLNSGPQTWTLHEQMLQRLTFMNKAKLAKAERIFRARKEKFRELLQKIIAESPTTHRASALIGVGVTGCKAPGLKTPDQLNFQPQTRLGDEHNLTLLKKPISNGLLFREAADKTRLRSYNISMTDYIGTATIHCKFVWSCDIPR
jgi:hypothetical protein